MGKLRPLGTGLSPNGLALHKKGMLSMVQLDGIVDVDVEGRTITVEAGARVSQILEELHKHNLTLSNFSSITEQQIAGWTQTSAHGTGARIPTVDEMITKMTVVTPGRHLGAFGRRTQRRLVSLGAGRYGHSGGRLPGYAQVHPEVHVA